jgi:hypothetical protein
MRWGHKRPPAVAGEGSELVHEVYHRDHDGYKRRVSKPVHDAAGRGGSPA